MIVNIDEFYNNNNYKQYVPLEAFQEEVQLVGKTLLKDVDVKNVLSITYSIDDYGESPIYIEYIDEKDQKHLVKLKPAIHEELDEVLKQYAKITYVDQKFNEAVQNSKDYTDETKEALTILINGSKEETIQINKAYTDVEINKLNTDLKEYIDSHDQTLWQEIVTYANSAIDQSFIQSKAYTDTEIDKVKNEITVGNDTVLQQAKDYADAHDNEKLVASKNYTDTKHEEALTAIEQGDAETLADAMNYTDNQLGNYGTKADVENANKIYGYNTLDTSWLKCNGNFTISHNGAKITDLGYRQNVEDEEVGIHFSDYATKNDITPLNTKLENIWGGHKAAFIYWLPNIDINTMKLENAENDVKVTLNDGDVVYWRKNEYQPSGAELNVSFGTEPTKTENSIAIRTDDTGKTVTSMYFTAEGNTATFNPNQYLFKSDAPIWGWNYYQQPAPSRINMTNEEDYVWANILTPKATLSHLKDIVVYLPKSAPVTQTEVEALVQEQNATNTENVSVSLQQKARTVQNITNNSTLVETKDFYILNLDFSFVPTVLPTSTETEFLENINIDAPQFVGKSFNITYKANDHSTISKGVIGEPFLIKTCVLPVDETIKSVEVVVKDKIIIRKETE